MIIEKHKPVNTDEKRIIESLVSDATTSQEQELYTTNALCEVYKAIRTILSGIKVNNNDPHSKPLFNTIQLNNGQLSRIKNNKWNKEYSIAFPAVFLHFINIRYLIQQSRVGEGRATMRVQYVLNRLNNSDPNHELEGYEIFQQINAAIQDRKSEFPALVERFQLTYFDQPESFDDGLQPFWIDYEVWFTEHSAYRYKNYVDRYVVVPPFTNHSDQLPDSNTESHENHNLPHIEDVTGFTEPE